MRKLLRPPSLNAQDVAPHVPAGWIDAANEVLDSNPGAESRAVLARILNDVRARSSWTRFDALVTERVNIGRHAGKLADWLEHFRRNLLLLLAAKGGFRRTRTTKQMLTTRRNIARIAEALRNALSGDPDTKDIDVEDVLHWATWNGKPVSKDIPLRRYVGNGNTFDTAPKLIQRGAVSEFQTIRVTALLDALAERLRAGDRLSFVDQITNEPSVQPGRGLQAHLEHSLADHLSSLAPLPGVVFAPLIEIALGLPKKSVDPARLEDRFRKIFAPAPKKASAKNRKT